MPLIIPFFIINEGCPHRCSFCNEAKAVGDYPAPITAALFRETVHAYLASNRRKTGPVQIAFYGGNFLGLEKGYRRELLEMAAMFIREGLVASVRISTRPDSVDGSSLDYLEQFSVKTVEIGVQSLVDDVLRRARRGHTAAQARRAVGLLKERGFATGVHLMVGLPGDSSAGFSFTVEETIALRPDMVRLHPTLVFSGTDLAESFRRGEYRPLSLAEAVSACASALDKFTAAGIPVIRLGLQPSQEMEKEGAIIAGPYHPAFGALVEEEWFFTMASRLLSGRAVRDGAATFVLSPRDSSSFRGQKNQNINAIKGRFGLTAISLVFDPAQARGTLALEAEGDRLQSA